MSNPKLDMNQEYSFEVDRLRQNRVQVSFFKYGPAKINFGEGLVKAKNSAEICIQKYEKTKNREYLLDAMNYLMFEFMYPSIEGTYFRATDSSESAERMVSLTMSLRRCGKDEYYLDIALAVSKRSTCIKRHYGCVIVNDDTIVATGYNGSPRGEKNCCDIGICQRADAERYTSYEQCCSVHAEQNALMAASHQQLKGATLYLACETYGLDSEKSAMWAEDIYGFYEDKNPVPCPLCKRMIRNSGIVRVVNRRGDIQCL